MKKYIRMLLAASFILISNDLLALLPTVTPELTVSATGSTIAIQETFLLSLCEPNSSHQYLSHSTNVRAYFCAVSLSKLNLPAGVAPLGNLAAKDLNNDGLLNVLFYFAPVTSESAVINNVCNTVSGAVLPVIDNTCDVIGGGFCSNVVNRSIDGGLIDLELNKLFPNNIACDNQTVNQTSIRGTIYNTPVSENLRNALQCVQGLTVGSEDESNMPSLSKGLIASIFNGGIADWNKLQAKKADGTYAPFSVALTDRVAQGLCPGYSTISSPIPSDTRIRVCRPPNGVASSSQFRIKFLNAICSQDAQDMLSDNTPQSSSSVNNVIADWQNVTPNISTSPAIIVTTDNFIPSCLGAFGSGQSNPDQKRWAIGISKVAGISTQARVIKIDNFAPTVKNVLEQHYFDWAESQWIWVNPNNATQDQKDKIDFQKIFLQKLNYVSSNTNVSIISSGYFMVNTIPGNTPTLPFDLQNPVATSTHAVGGTSNSCRTPAIKVNTSF